MKKIISFSLWGQNPLYCNGAIANAEMRPDFYPEWICRYYLDDSIPEGMADRLRAFGCEVIVMPRSVDVLGMYWRFRPMFDDPDIERFIVRDLDSKFTKREVRMVDEWTASGKPFHIVRDNPSHNVTILGGTWGAIPGCVPGFKDRMSHWLSMVQPEPRNPRGLFHGTDQIFLHACVWPFIKDNHCCHILAGCDKLKFNGQEIEVPEPEDRHYVGMVA